MLRQSMAHLSTKENGLSVGTSIDVADLSEKNPFVKAVPSYKSKPKKSKKKQRDVLKEKDAIQDCSKDDTVNIASGMLDKWANDEAQAVTEEMQKVYQNELGPEPIPFTVPGHAIDDEDRYFLEVDNASDDDGNVENLSENAHENRRLSYYIAFFFRLQLA
ncbi:hypothetical protein Q3G72_001806 [Acer saccharum]|nr:hypothetical protein Q3G72_001806 [Acer saccharum]